EQNLHAILLCTRDCLFHIRQVVITLRSWRVIYSPGPVRTMPQPNTDERRPVIAKYPIWVPLFAFIAIQSAVIKNLVDVRQIHTEMKFAIFGWIASGFAPVVATGDQT